MAENARGNERAVLVALLAATGSSDLGAVLCEALVDRAADLLINAPAGVLSAIGGAAHAEDRLAGLAVLSELCGQCRLCSRGQLAGDGAGKLGPIAAAKWRAAQ